jgi:hypothetical protein
MKLRKNQAYALRLSDKGTPPGEGLLFLGTLLREEPVVTPRGAQAVAFLFATDSDTHQEVRHMGVLEVDEEERNAYRSVYEAPHTLEVLLLTLERWKTLFPLAQEHLPPALLSDGGLQFFYTTDVDDKGKTPYQPDELRRLDLYLE